MRKAIFSDAATGTSKKKGGKVTKAFGDAMARRNINAQIYWNETPVGPDTRRFQEHHKKILGTVKAAMITNSASPEVASAFYDRHCAVLKPHAIVTRFGRKNAPLSPGEVSDLRAA